MEKFLKLIDLFPYNFGLTFQKKNNYQTNIGGCVSIIYLILVLICVVIFSENLRERMDPKLVYLENYYHENNILRKISNENFILGIFIEKIDSEIIINENLFSLLALYEDEKGKTFEIKFNKCSEIYSKKKNSTIEPLFKGHEKYLTNGTFLDFSLTNKDFQIDPFKTKIKFEINCKKENKSNCVYNKEIRNLLLDSSFELFVLDTILDTSKLYDPIIKDIYSQEVFLNPELENFLFIFYDALQIETDNGFFYKNSEINSGFKKKRINQEK
jgi:hypothetical protein